MFVLLSTVGKEKNLFRSKNRSTFRDDIKPRAPKEMECVWERVSSSVIRVNEQKIKILSSVPEFREMKL